MSPRHQRKPGRGLLAALPALPALPALLLGLAPAAPSADCDRDGVRDDVAIADGTSPDCDGDGVPDACALAAALFATIEVGILVEPPRAIALADIDGDRDLDVAAVTRFSRFQVLENDGTGRFDCASGGCWIPRHFASGPLRLRTADLDGDGALDLAVGDRARIDLFADGPGGGAPIRKASLPSLASAELDIAAGDLDGDGETDLVVTVPFGLALWRGDGAWSFEIIDRVEVGSNPVRVAAADVDGDGDLDLATANRPPGIPRGDNIGLLVNDGRGRFTPTWNRFVGAPLTALIAADLDGDGRPDLAAGADGAVVVMRNVGAGEFAGPRRFETLGQAVFLEAGDADDDGQVDLIAMAEGGDVGVLWNDGRGEFDTATVVEFAALAGETIFPAVGDVDGDRRIDLVFGYPMRTGLRVFRGAPGRSFAAPRFLPSGRPRTLAGADLDGDGDTDLAIADSITRDIVIRLNEGGGTFSVRRSVRVGQVAAIAPADLDGDGAVDLAAVIPGSRAVTPIWNDGAGEFTTGTPLEIGAEPSSAAVGDWDLDGDLDLAVGTRQISNVHVFHNEGSREFLRVETKPIALGTSDIEAGDLDGDRDLDLVTANTSSGTVSVLRNPGDGRFGPSENIALDLAPIALVLADLDGDGRLDAAVVSGSGDVDLLINNGDGAFAVDGRLHGLTSKGIDAGDVDGDGRVDLVLGGPRVFLNRGGLRFDALDVSTFVGEPYASFIDADGDGFLDVVAAAPAAGGIVLHLSNPVRDRDRNGIPDSCEPDSDGNGVLFHRGDPNASGRTDLADAVFLLDWIFLDGGPIACLESADVDDNDTVNVADPIALVGFLFEGGPPPAAPGPTSQPCGLDPDDPPSASDLGCETYLPCR